MNAAGPKYPPRCSGCMRELQLSATGKAVSFDPCPDHPRARSIYRLQEPRDGYPAGWPLCIGVRCDRPALDGKATCGDAVCSRARL